MKKPIPPRLLICLASLLVLPALAGPGDEGEAFVLLKRQLLRGPGAYEAFCKEHDAVPRGTLRKQVTETLKALREASRAELAPFLEEHPEVHVGEWLTLVNAVQIRGPRESLDLLAAHPAVEKVHSGKASTLFRRLERPDLPAAQETLPGVEEPPLDLSKVEVPWNLGEIGAEAAWKEEGVTGRGIVIAIIDMHPVCYTTPALRDALWTNPGETPGNGQDDDGNGYVDDVHGWNFPKDSPDLLGKRVTHPLVCSGILLGREAGGLVTGVAPRAKLMMLMGQRGLFSALQYALDQGADVVSMSFMFPAEEEMRALWRLACEQASCAGLVLGGGAGNNGERDGETQIQTPKDIPCVLCVAGVLRDRTRPSYSSRGPVRWDGQEVRKPDFCGFSEGYPTQGVSGPVQDGRQKGNSYSGPHALGVAALVLEANPDLKPWQVLKVMRDTARDLFEKGWDPLSGWGLLDASAAVKAAAGMKPRSCAVEERVPEGRPDPGSGQDPKGQNQPEG